MNSRGLSGLSPEDFFLVIAQRKKRICLSDKTVVLLTMMAASAVPDVALAGSRVDEEEK